MNTCRGKWATKQAILLHNEHNAVLFEKKKLLKQCILAVEDILFKITYML